MEALTWTSPPLFMWVLALSVFAGCKWLTWPPTAAVAAPWWKHAGYLLAWPGMDAMSFLTGHSKRRPDAAEWTSCLGRIILGLALFFGAARFAPSYLTGWTGMIGVVLTLHFGVFHLLSCLWRRIGVEARPLMDRPIDSISLGEFWGRRWNTAFRDLTHRFLFRPLAPWVGARGAILAGFLFSGLVHDFVISLPARGGYGGPTLFFVIQGGAMLFERSGPGRRLGLGQGWRGRVFTTAVVLGPLYWLFHPPFINNIVLPSMHALGAI